MKLLVKFTFVIVFTIFSSLAFSQTPPHPNGGNIPGSGNTPVGGGAPVGSGLIILLALASGYGAKKLYTIRKESLIE